MEDAKHSCSWFSALCGFLLRCSFFLGSSFWLASWRDQMQWRLLLHHQCDLDGWSCISLSGNSEVCATWAIVEIVQPEDFKAVYWETSQEAVLLLTAGCFTLSWPCMKLSASACVFSSPFLFILLSFVTWPLPSSVLAHPYNLPQFSPSLFPFSLLLLREERRKPGMGLELCWVLPFFSSYSHCVLPW